MTHTLPFSRFKTFVLSFENQNLVYMNLYCLIELYKTKLRKLLQIAETCINYTNTLESKEYMDQQLVVGKTMMAILEYIKANNSKFGNCLIINLAEMNSSEVAEESIMSESSK